MSFKSCFRMGYQMMLALTILLLLVIFNTATYDHQLIIAFCLLVLPVGILYARAVSKIMMQDITLVVCRGFSKSIIAYSTIQSARLVGPNETFQWARGKKIEVFLKNNKVKSFYLEDADLFLSELDRHLARVG